MDLSDYAKDLFVEATQASKPCPSSGSATATTIKSPSSSSLELRSFMPGCELPSMDWMRASSPRATSLPASGGSEADDWTTAIAGRSKEVVGEVGMSAVPSAG